MAAQTGVLTVTVVFIKTFANWSQTFANTSLMLRQLCVVFVKVSSQTYWFLGHEVLHEQSIQLTTLHRVFMKYEVRSLRGSHETCSYAQDKFPVHHSQYQVCECKPWIDCEACVAKLMNGLQGWIGRDHSRSVCKGFFENYCTVYDNILARYKLYVHLCTCPFAQEGAKAPSWTLATLPR